MRVSSSLFLPPGGACQQQLLSPTPASGASTRLSDCNRQGPGASQLPNHINLLKHNPGPGGVARWLRRESQTFGLPEALPRALEDVGGFPGAPLFWELGRPVYRVFPTYKSQRQKEHLKSASWNLPVNLEALI